MPQARKIIVLDTYNDPNLLLAAGFEIKRCVQDRFEHSEVRTSLLPGGLEVHLPPECPDVFIEIITERHGLCYRTKNSDQSS